MPPAADRPVMELVDAPSTLTCAECGEEVRDAGYLPATTGEDGYEPAVDDAVCDACGFNEVGMLGCAPELDEVTEPGPDDVLLYVRPTDGGIDVVSVKE